MLLKIKPRFKTFDDYFSEADDDEYTQDNSTTNKIVVKPHKRRGNDYTAMEPEPEDDTPADDATDYTDTSGATGNEDSNDGESNEPEDDTPADDATDYTDTSGATGNEDSNDGEDSSEDDGEGNDDAAVLADDSDAEGTDYTDTGDGGEGGDSDSSDDNQQDDQDQNKNDTEAYKKFYLFRKFSSLYNRINTYCKTLQSSSYDDVYYSTVIKAVIDRLSEVSKCINEYLIMKFDNVSYVEGCIYYETVFNIVKLSIEMLKNNSEKAKQLSK